MRRPDQDRIFGHLTTRRLPNGVRPRAPPTAPSPGHHRISITYKLHVHVLVFHGGLRVSETGEYEGLDVVTVHTGSVVDGEDGHVICFRASAVFDPWQCGEARGSRLPYTTCIYTMQYSLCVAVLKKAMAVLYMRCDMCTVGG